MRLLHFKTYVKSFPGFILSHPLHYDQLLHGHLLNTDDNIIYQQRPSFIPPFGNKIRRLIEKCPLSNIEVSPCPQHLYPPMKTLNIISLHPFKTFEKNSLARLFGARCLSRKTVCVQQKVVAFEQLFSAHRAHFNKYIKKYIRSSSIRRVIKRRGPD